jgi:hypothetical protein
MQRAGLVLQTKGSGVVRVLVLPMLMVLVEEAGQGKLVAQAHQHLVETEAMVSLPQLQAHPWPEVVVEAGALRPLELLVVLAVQVVVAQRPQLQAPAVVQAQQTQAVVEVEVGAVRMAATAVQAWSSLKPLIPWLLPSQAVLPKPHQLLVALLFTPWLQPQRLAKQSHSFKEI